MRLILVNPKQTIAVLASGLAIATTGFVTDAGASRSSSGAASAAVARGAAADETALGPHAARIQASKLEDDDR